MTLSQRSLLWLSSCARPGCSAGWWMCLLACQLEAGWGVVFLIVALGSSLTLRGTGIQVLVQKALFRTCSE